MRNALSLRFNKGFVRFVLSGLLATGFAAQVSGKAFIVEDGQPKAAIVIAEQPTRMQKLAAEELQKYVKKITGAELPIGSKPSAGFPVNVYIGESEYTRKLGLTTDDLKYGAYRITSGDDYLALVGRDDDMMEKPDDSVFAKSRSDRERAAKAWKEKHGEKWTPVFQSTFKGYNKALGVWRGDEQGSLNGVNDFLRWLGVRWYMPGDFGEICPTMTSIPVPELDATVRPEWTQRRPHFHGCNPFQCGAVEMLWQLRMGLHGGEKTVGGHGTDILIHSEWAKNHPDVYALYGDKRGAGPLKPCYSSEGLFDSAVEFAQVMHDEYGMQTFSASPTDGYGAFCQCDLCKGKDTPERGYKGMMSDYVWDFMNRLAAEVARTHPDMKIMCFAYNTYVLPPEKIDRFHPNLRVRLTQGRKGFVNPEYKKTYLAARAEFLKKIPDGKISLHEWYNARAGCFFPHIIAEDLKRLKGKIHGSVFELSRSERIADDDQKPVETLAASHLNVWLTTRLWWNPDAEEMWWTKGRDAEGLLEEYYDNFYGPAAKEMKEFIEFCEKNQAKMLVNAELIEKAFSLIAMAREAAGDDNINARRVQLVMDSLEPWKTIRDQLKVGRSGNPVAQFTEFDELPIKLDGKLDEPFWNDLETFELRDIVTGDDLSTKTTFKVAWAGDSLYFGVHCEEQNMDKLVVPAKADGDNSIFDGDSIEFLLETPTHAYYQIAVDPKGHVNDLDRPNSIIIGKTGKYETKWDAGIDVAAFKGKEFWSVEAKIPALGAGQEELLPFFGVSGDKPTKDAPWYFNVGRVRKAGLESMEASTFSPTGTGGFHYMRKFARLQPE